MKILFLGNKDLELYDWLLANGDEVTFIRDRITIDNVSRLEPTMIVSHSYRYIISKDIIQHVSGNIINLHISYLPWNRGSSPNLWSFIDNTKKGVTIHFIDEGIDTGDIIVQRELDFDENIDTLYTSYNRLQEEIKQMFKDSWGDIIGNNLKAKPQDKASGSIHYDRQTNKLMDFLGTPIWDTPITDLRERL